MRAVPVRCRALQVHLERLVEMLLQRGAMVDLQNSKGDSALALAAPRGHERVVEMLLQRGASLDPQDSNGFTPLIYAAYYGHARYGYWVWRWWGDHGRRQAEASG